MEMFKNFNLPKNFEEHNLKQNLIKYALLVLAARRYRDTGLFHNSINCKEVPSPNFEKVPTQKKIVCCCCRSFFVGHPLLYLETMPKASLYKIYQIGFFLSFILKGLILPKL
jgi:hypothetical protein